MNPTLTRIPVFFRPEMVALGAHGFAPGAGKPAEVIADWQARALPIELRGLDPVSRDDLVLAHDPAYVDGVLGGRLVNGFGNRKPQVAASLPFTSGAMHAAAIEALRNGQVACAPVAGFHHARYREAHGFCTFNGLIVAAMALKAAGRVERVGILDLDQHWGDGTHDLIGHLGLDWISHHSAGRHAPSAPAAEPYLRRLPGIVSTFHDCDLLLYQAGADAHVDDPLGGWMTSEQLTRRDRTVFEVADMLGLPVAWNLAGGYQRDADNGIEPVLAIHRSTLACCAAVFCQEVH